MARQLRPVDPAVYRRALLLRVAAVRGLRVVPREPGSDFPAVPFACYSAPARCGDCAMHSCPHGYTPGLPDATEPWRYWQPKPRAAAPPSLIRMREQRVTCARCGVLIVGRDATALLRNLLEHDRFHEDDSA
ncbi:MAG TPA: hypothetical protein VF841_17250 [Anaeromyxobacter sp.]